MHSGGRHTSLPVLRTDGRLTLDLGPVDADAVERLEVGWPSSLLDRYTLVDTPGTRRTPTRCPPGRWRSSPPTTAPAPADAVVYLMRSLHSSDVELLREVQEHGANGGPLGVIGVLSRTDETGGGRGAPLVRDGADDSPALAAALVRHSGLTKLRQTLDPTVRRSQCRSRPPSRGGAPRARAVDRQAGRPAAGPHSEGLPGCRAQLRGDRHNGGPTSAAPPAAVRMRAVGRARAPISPSSVQQPASCWLKAMKSRQPHRSTILSFAMRKMWIPRSRRTLPSGGTSNRSPVRVPEAWKCSTTRSPSAMSGRPRCASRAPQPASSGLPGACPRRPRGRRGTAGRG